MGQNTKLKALISYLNRSVRRNIGGAFSRFAFRIYHSFFTVRKNIALQRLRTKPAGRPAQIEKLQTNLKVKSDQIVKLKNRLNKNSGKIEKLQTNLKVKSDQIVKLKNGLNKNAEKIESLQSKLKVKSAYYNIARQYFPVYRMGILYDEIEKSDINLSADCYLSLLPSTVPAAHRLSRSHGGIVVCDCVENIEIDRHSLAPNIHWPALDLVNFAAYGSLLSVDKILTIGNELASTLERFDRPLMVAPNFRRFEEPDPAGELRAACGLAPSDVLLFASGNVVVGFEPVLDALAALPEHIHLAAMVRLKPPEYEAAMMARIADLGLASRVHFFPFVPYERLASMAADADVGLITSDVANPNGAVGLPNRFSDYLTAGLPIIAPPMPDVVSLLRTHGCGTHLPEVSAEAWHDAVKRVLADLPRYRVAATEARKRLTWESLEDDLYEFLGRPRVLTMLGFRDLSRYQRFLRIAHSLTARGTKVKAVFLSGEPAPVTIPGADLYYYSDRYGLGPGLARVPHPQMNRAANA